MSGDRPLRILVVTNLYPSAAQPTFGSFVATHVTALRRQGMHVEVVAILDPRTGQRVASKYARLAITVVSRALLARVRRQRYDVVEAHIAFPTGLVAFPASLVHNARLVLFVHGSDVARVARHSRITRGLFRALVRQASAVVVNSEHMRLETAGLAGSADTPIEVISPGIDLELFGVNALADTGRVGILYVGRLAPEKGIDVLLESLVILGARGIRLVVIVIGGGELRAAAEGRTAELGLDVRFEGSRPPRQVAAAMQAARVVVVPSIREGLGLVALEAMAAGALVVASHVGGLAETVLDGHTGIAVKSGDPVALADGIERALAVDADHTARSRMVTAALAMAEGHAVDRSVARTVELYRRLLERRG